jgi:hypothetical protein
VAEEAELACYPWSVSTWLLAVWGLATAGMSWFFPGAALLSQWAHLLVGAALLGFALFGVWRPVVVVRAGALVQHARFVGRPQRIELAEIDALVEPPRTGHRPSEEDLAAQLGLRLRSGEFRWIDLRWLRRGDRARLRARLRPAADHC